MHLHLAPDSLILVNDSPAMAPDIVARLGEPFYRPPGQRESGCGLGLAIAGKIAALHGCRLQVSQVGNDASGVLHSVGTLGMPPRTAASHVFTVRLVWEDTPPGPGGRQT